MNCRKILSFLLLLSMIFVLVVGCSAGEDPSTETTASSNSSTDSSTDVSEEPIDPTIDITVFPTNLAAQQVGTLKEDNIRPAHGGVIYEGEEGKFGIFSLDGKRDTGVKYAACTPLSRYFVVCEAVPASVEDVKSLNAYGLVDVDGKILVPLQYADVQMLNDRFVKVCTVTQIVEKSYDAVHCYTKEEYPTLVTEEPVYYQGTWLVYDLTTGKTVSGVGGTHSYDAYAYGDHIRYTNDEGKTLIVDGSGNALAEGSKLLENGCYILFQGKDATVYDDQGKVLFSYSKNDYEILHGTDTNFTVLKKGKFQILGLDGTAISSSFDEMPAITGGKIYSGNKLYSFDGKPFVSGSLNEVFVDKQLGHHMILRKGKTHTLINKDGTVVCSGSESDGIFFDTYNFLSYKKVEDKNLYYSLKDQDYTLQGSAVAPWMVKVESSDGTFDFVNVISGETLLSGYRGYLCSEAENTAYYVYARRANGNVDIFIVK